jgi:hypothetical protein
VKLVAHVSIGLGENTSRAFAKNSGELDKSACRNRPSGERWPGMRQRQSACDAEKARGDEIALRTRWERVVFIAGLVGAVLLVSFSRSPASGTDPACGRQPA